MKRPVEHDPNLLKADGPTPVMDVARDLVKRGVIIAPISIMIGAAIWQTEGALSVAYALAIVTVNFFIAALLLDKAAQISFAAMGAAAVFGFFTRLSLVTVAVLVVRSASWIELIPLTMTIVIAHLGLLFWEMRYISISLANPGLKPSQKLPIHTAADDIPNHETTGAA